MNTAPDTSRHSVARWLSQLKQPGDEACTKLGSLEFAPFQTRAAHRLKSIVETWGGALLADAVGMGKTRVALAAAVSLRRAQPRPREPIVVVAPARVVDHWTTHARRAGIHADAIRMVTHTSLSRGFRIEAASVVIADEAHRFRNPSARRTTELARVASLAPLLLVTATPVARDLGDLHHLLGLFVRNHDVRRVIGVDLNQAFDLAADREFDLAELMLHVCVRREAGDFETELKRPSTRFEVITYEPCEHEAWIWRCLESEINRLDLGILSDDWPRGLFGEHILRRWESGPESLLETLKSLENFQVRWLEANAMGRSLDRREFRQLFEAAPDQSVFGFMFKSDTEATHSRSEVRADLAAIRAIIERVEAVVEAPGGMEGALLNLIEDGEKILIFTAYKSAAHGLYSRLVGALGADARVGMITGNAARATGIGRTRAREILQRFAPEAAGQRLAHHQQLQVLVATDCISEGIDLHDCGRIVLADLPYTPLAIEQRVGRLVRPTSTHACVDVYLPRPQNWNDSLGLRRRLRARLDDAAHAGAEFTTLRSSPLSSNSRPDNPLRALSLIDSIIEPGDEPQPQHLRISGEKTEGLLIVEFKLGSLQHRTLLYFDADSASWKFADSLEFLHKHLEASVLESRLPQLPPHVAHAIDARRSRIQSALDAPLFLPSRSPQMRAWNRLRDTVDDSELSDLRDRLLVPRTRGVETRLEQLLEANSATDLLEFARALEPISVATEVTLQILATLMIDPRAPTHRSDVTKTGP